jgi:hypothetical protein
MLNRVVAGENGTFRLAAGAGFDLTCRQECAIRRLHDRPNDLDSGGVRWCEAGVVKLQLMSSAWPGVEKAVLPSFPALVLRCSSGCTADSAERTRRRMGSDDAGMKCRREFYEQPP